jgi:hypothetical protein
MAARWQDGETMESFIFCVDTDSYAGQFERPMCAYMTGRLRDCGVGAGEAALADAELDEKTHSWFGDYIRREVDDWNCMTPVSIVPTSGLFCAGGVVFRDLDADPIAVRAAADRQTHQLCDEAVAVIAGHLAAGRLTLERATASTAMEMRIRDNALTQPLRKHPVYYSVGIFLKIAPPIEIVKVLQERAYRFANMYTATRAARYGETTTLTVTGFRLLQVVTTVKPVLLAGQHG